MKFPDKNSIRLDHAKDYLQDAIGIRPEDEYVKSFLEVLGYKSIEIASGIKNHLDDDIKLEDILKMDWSPKRSISNQGVRSHLQCRLYGQWQ